MLLQDVAMETNNDRQMDMAMQRRLIHIGRRDICAGLIGAGITAIIVGFIGVGPWRYQAAPFASGYNAAAGCYIIDTWTGNAKLWLYGDEQPMRTVRQQRRVQAAQATPIDASPSDYRLWPPAEQSRWSLPAWAYNALALASWIAVAAGIVLGSAWIAWRAIYPLRHGNTITPLEVRRRGFWICAGISTVCYAALVAIAYFQA